MIDNGMTTRTFRCLLVDDEALILQRLELLLGAMAPEFALAGCAYSGEEAIELADRLRPDIVVTDIVMPGIDGIEMVERWKARHPLTEFIILTAYKDFDYAKRALRNQVHDYLTKVPLKEGELYAALRRAAASIGERERRTEQLFELSAARQEHKYRIRRQLVSELLQGAISPARIERVARDTGIHLGHYCCLVIEIDQYEPFCRAYSGSDRAILKYGLLNIVEETINRDGDGFACELDDSRLIGWVSWPTVRSEAVRNEYGLQLGGAIVANVRQYLRLSVSVGFSAFHNGWGGMPEAFKQAQAALEDVYYSAGGAVVTPMSRLRYEPAQAEALTALFHRLYDALKREQAESEAPALMELIAQAAGGRRIPRQVMTAKWSELLGGLHGTMLALKKQPPAWSAQALAKLSFADQLGAVRQYVSECLRELRPVQRPEIVKAKQLIERNLTRKLTLHEIAEHVNLAPTYFSALFKKEVQENLIDYINRKKIERAAEMLKTGDYSNHELSDAVGIFNERYFCTLFKDHYAITPQKYRKRFR